MRNWTHRSLAIPAAILGLTGLMGQSECNPIEVPAKTDLSVSLNLFDTTGQPLLAEDGSASEKATIEAEPVRATVRLWLYDCAAPDGYLSVEPYVNEDVPVALGGTNFFPAVAEPGHYCVSGEVETGEGQLYATLDLIRGQDGAPYFPDAEIPEVELDPDLVPLVTLNTLQVVSVEEEVDILFDKNIIIGLEDWTNLHLTELLSPTYEMTISGCVYGGGVPGASPAMSFHTVHSFETGTLDGFNNNGTFLIYDQAAPVECRLDLTISEPGRTVARASTTFSAPPGDGDDYYIGDLFFDWTEDANLDVTFIDLGDFWSMVLTLDPIIMEYLEGYSDPITWEMIFEPNDHSLDTVQVNLDQDGDILSGDIVLENATYQVTIRASAGGQTILSGITDGVNVAEGESLDLTLEYRLILTANGISLVNVYPRAATIETDGSITGVSGVSVAADCTDNATGEHYAPSTGLTGVYVDADGERDPRSGAYTALVQVPVGSTCTFAYSKAGYASATYDEPVIAGNLDTLVLDYVYLNAN